MSVACFLGIELLFLAATHLYGGPPWTLLGMIAFFAQIAAGLRLVEVGCLNASGFYHADVRQLAQDVTNYLERQWKASE